MNLGKIIMGYIFVTIGLSCSVAAIYMLVDDRLESVFEMQLNVKIEVVLFLIFSLLLSFSGFKTIQKENRKNKLKQSDLLDD